LSNYLGGVPSVPWLFSLSHIFPHHHPRGGTPEYDEEGWTHYVDTHRKADPALSGKGRQQAKLLAEYLIAHIENQASHPIRIITSPMRRTLETIRPTLEGLQQTATPEDAYPKVHIIVCAFYHESEGCHNKDTPEEGMTPDEIRSLLKNCVQDIERDIEFVGFPDPNRGWYMLGTGPETRALSEARAAKFYMWFNEYLDGQLAIKDHDLFDAGVSIEGEEEEDENDKLSKRIRRRRTAVLVGHGDFMSLVMKRLIAGYGHSVETEGIPHRKYRTMFLILKRGHFLLYPKSHQCISIFPISWIGSAFAHFNTGISEFEYFGHGRFLAMATNQTPHIPRTKEYAGLRSGGSLKDGWSYLMPADKFVLNAEVSVAFSDEDMEDHVREQTNALKALYLSSKTTTSTPAGDLQVESEDNTGKQVQFVVKRGLQVVGVATYSEETGQLTDVAIRPSAAASDRIGQTLMDSVRKHARKLGRSTSLVVFPRSDDNRDLFEGMGFSEIVNEKMVASID
jgi:broad specificity phosphatase PhoE